MDHLDTTRIFNLALVFIDIYSGVLFIKKLFCFLDVFIDYISLKKHTTV